MLVPDLGSGFPPCTGMMPASPVLLHHPAGFALQASPAHDPRSEPESNLVREVAVLFQPHIWINVHSGMEALFMPFDHKVGTPDGSAGPSSNATLAMLHALNREVFGGRCVVGPGGKSVGYLAHGTATDYMHGVLKIPISLTWEVYGDESAGECAGAHA